MKGNIIAPSILTYPTYLPNQGSKNREKITAVESSALVYPLEVSGKVAKIAQKMHPVCYFLTRLALLTPRKGHFAVSRLLLGVSSWILDMMSLSSAGGAHLSFIAIDRI